VDSGAQSTIISKKMAEQIGIMNLLDKRFAGMAVGVGTSKILGRVHAAKMEILGRIFVCSFTVLEDNKVDLLFGLDNLKRHQCCIDLVQGMLHMRNAEISVPFLSEGEIKKNEFEEQKELMMEKQKSLGTKFNENDVKHLMDVFGAT
jgi:DNA damage-inducible protein 1